MDDLTIDEKRQIRDRLNAELTSEEQQAKAEAAAAYRQKWDSTYFASLDPEKQQEYRQNYIHGRL